MQTSITHHTALTFPPIGTAGQKPFPARRFTGIFDRYAETDLPRAINEFVDVTVHGVRDLNENIDDETACIVDDVHPHFFSVYLRHESGEEECVGDFSAYKHACDGAWTSISLLLVFAFCEILGTFFQNSLRLCLHIDGSGGRALVSHYRLCDIERHTILDGQRSPCVPQRMR